MSRAPARIAVVGGGPAGATAAHRLARSGAVVTLFESRPAGEKPCGGGIPSRALADFPELQVGGLERRVVREVRIHSPSGRGARVTIPNGLHMFRRCELDAHLRSSAVGAGVTLRTVRVNRVRRASGGVWEVATEEGDCGPYDFLVGADGVNGVVRRQVAPAAARRDLTLALYAYVPRVARTDLVLKFFGDFDGYFWAFPRARHVSVGICARSGTVPVERLEDELFATIERHYPEGRFPGMDLKGYLIPSGLQPPAAVSRGEGWALVGDAAGFVDPITREGIVPAMRSAAQAAAAFARRGVVRTPPLPGELGRAHRLRSIFYSESFLENLIRLAEGSPAIRSVLGDLLEGTQSYRGLRRRLLINVLPAGLQMGFGGIRSAIRSIGPLA